MITFSANLGFLWTDRSLPDAIRAAGAAGFDAVECHMPYEFSTVDVRTALSETGLSMVSLNTLIGDQEGDFGVAAIPGREELARQYIDQAIDYAVAIDCPNVSVVAGRSGRTDEAEAVYRSNLSYAATRAADVGRTVLIEPLNTEVAADYHLVSADAAMKTVQAIGANNLKIMVDCFHSRKMDGELRPVFERVMPYVGHIQISAFPDRGEPTDGDPTNDEIVYSELLPWLREQGFAGPFGAEYTPRGDLDAGLSWLDHWRNDDTQETN